MREISNADELRALFERAHPNGRGVGRAKSRFVRGAGVDLEVFLSGMLRDAYEAGDSARAAAGCRLCAMPASARFESLALAADQYPFFPYHLLLRPLREGAVGTLDCRPGACARDFAGYARLVERFPKYVVSHSAPGSGASIPTHTHAHAFPIAEAFFPLLSPRLAQPLPNSGARRAVVRRVTFAFVLREPGETCAALIEAFSREFGSPVNCVWWRDGLRTRAACVVVPRTAEVPAIAQARACDWKFGAFEVLGLFDAKTSDIYERITARDLIDGVASVTCTDTKMRAEMTRWVDLFAPARNALAANY